MFDYVISISIGNFAAEISMNIDVQLMNGIIAVLIFGFIAMVISILTMKSILLRRIVIGSPTILIENGKFVYKNLKRVKIDINDFLESARIKGYFDISNIKYALMEANGQISFLPKEEYVPATPKDLNLKPSKQGLCANVIIDGKFMLKNLEKIKKDVTLLKYLEEDNVILDSFSDLAKFPILENKSPKLCTDRLDGVLHTCYIWLHTHPLEDIAEVYQDMAVLINENGREEIGFRHKRIATKFCKMVYVYAKELWSNRSKYVSKYVSEIVKLAVEEEKITLDDLYTKKEVEIVSIFKKTFSSWNLFEDATCIMGSEEEPSFFSISFLAKKRNVIPLVQVRKSSMRICDTSIIAKNIYNQLEQYQDYKYGFVESIKEIC